MGGNGVAKFDSERAEELIGQFDDAFNKTEYNDVPLTRRSVSFMDSIVVSTEGVIKLLKLPRLGKRELIVLFVRLFDLRLFGFVCFLFLLVSGKGCGSLL